MQISEPKNPGTPRHPLWSKDTLKEELSRKASTLTEICKKYSPTGRWRALYADVRRWRATDEELENLVSANTAATDSNKRKTFKGGRPSKELHAPDWRRLFCDKLLETKSRIEASAATPYTYDEIYKKLNQNYAEYDKEFAEMVHLAEMRQVARAEQVIWESLELEQSHRNRAWIAKEILKVRASDRWSDKLNVSVEHKGVVKFELNRQRVLAELAQEQVSQLSGAQRALEAGQLEILDVEAEEVKDNV